MTINDRLDEIEARAQRESNCYDPDGVYAVAKQDVPRLIAALRLAVEHLEYREQVALLQQIEAALRGKE